MSAWPRVDEFLLTMMLAMTGCGLASHHAVATPAGAVAAPKSVTMLERLDQAEWAISRSVGLVADGLDSFFANERLDNERTGSFVKLSLLGTLIEGEDPSSRFRFSTRLILPRTQEKLQLLLEADDEGARGEESLAVGQEVGTAPVSPRQDFNLGLRGRWLQTRAASLQLDGGVRAVWPPDPFVRLRGRYSFFFSDFELRLSEKVFWYDSRGFGHSAGVDLDRVLSPKWLFRWSNAGDYLRSEHEWNYTHAMNLSHQVSSRFAMGYSAGLRSSDEPALGIDSYFVSASSRYALIKDWLFLEIGPFGTWPREQNFTFVPGIAVKLESVFADSRSRADDWAADVLRKQR